ncbi:MAG: hypothetical protein CTY20_03115 [Hyphomicrobium sp.]|nr:MAG: hypothetical protein CTY20_03115 [Hyphomicrobium sp.]
MIEFTSRGYTDLLSRFLAAGYAFAPATQAMAAPAPALFLSHDVDFSLIRAVAMAEAEHALGVTSTYYIMLANEHYNAVSVTGRALIRRLVELGHEVGLHWDSETYPGTREAAVSQFKAELGVLGSVVGAPVRTASQHRPASSDYLNFDDQIEVEAYSTTIRERFAYVSDSAMRWRERTPLDYLAARRDVQFTAHPVWWFTNAASADDKLREVVVEQHGLRDELCEAAISRMNRVLATRETTDAAFRAKRGWSKD